jgi:type I restriction-modification system DNA methylase subunit
MEFCDMGSAPKEVIDLIEQFERNIESYKGQGYKEAGVRREFIDPFFEALGWDIANKGGTAEAYKDVIHEDAIKIGGTTKAPDYCFTISGTRKFFVEAKKPSVDIKSDISPAYQLRRYAWSAKLPLSILTNFEEFAVYDCQIRPNVNDKPSTARIFYCTYKEYGDKWEQIANIFGKEAVRKGLFDTYASEKTTKRGTTTVDKEFLAEIEGWRNELAKNIAIRNGKLSVYDLNFAVQKTIDRILFLRICEDRGIERSEQLLGLISGSRIYPRLFELFEKADEKYNSGIFHFRREKDRPEGPDELSAKLKVDDDILKKIIRNLYYPCPYEFSVMPAEILGQVYEQFLGKVIRLTESHQAKVEPKPEVKKAGGVYYTPSYIVDYIVKNTVGKLCENKTPKQIEKLKILDPACGSGSFLIGAYQYLLDFHRDYYAKEPSKHKKVIYQGKGKQWFLTIDEKKRILLNSIYGVDIDSQAAEVTKLSLLLKVLENETQESLRLFHERALPDLGNNIKCGNSLIGPDFYQKQQLNLFDDQQQRKINAFDWQKEFSPIFKQDGFDAVIGNPPYGASFSEEESEYFDRYKAFGAVKDVYICFIEKSIAHLNSGGRFSFIVPSAWLGGPEYEKLREMILNYQIENVVLLPFDVFADAYVDTTIFVVSKRKPGAEHMVQTYVYDKHEKLTKINLSAADFKNIHENEWVKNTGKKFILDPDTVQILKTIWNHTNLTLDDVIKIKRGVLFDKSLLTKKKRNANSHPYFEGDVYRYQLNLIADNWIEFGDRLKECPKEFVWFEGTRVLLRRLVNRQQRIMATLANETFITNKNLYSVLSKEKTLDDLVILGILNSRLISYLYLNQVTQATKDDFPQVTIKDLLALPFPAIVDGAKQNTRHRKMVSLVEQMLELHKKVSKIKNPDEKTRIQRQIDATDAQIDKLVYDLYGLSEDEIKIVENN